MSTTTSAPSTLVRRFKSIDPREAKRREEAAKHTPNRNSFSLFKPNVTPYKFKDGKNLLRLLPQPIDSPYDWCVKVDVLQFFSDNSPLRGTFRVMDNGRDGILNRARKLLRDHSQFKYRMKTKENPTGVNLSPRPKVIFLGFEITASEFKVQPVVLPGTLEYKTQDGKDRPPQAGTQIMEMCYDVDSNNNLRTGNVYDITTGRVIHVDVFNAGTIQVRYLPKYDDVYNLDKPQFVPVLEQIMSWDHYLEETTNADLVTMLRGYLPQDMYDFLDTQMGLATLLTDTPAVEHEEVEEGEADIPLPQDEPTATVATPAAQPKPAATVAQTAAPAAEVAPTPAPAAEPAATAAPKPDLNTRMSDLKQQLAERKAKA